MIEERLSQRFDWIGGLASLLEAAESKSPTWYRGSLKTYSTRAQMTT